MDGCAAAARGDSHGGRPVHGPRRGAQGGFRGAAPGRGAGPPDRQHQPQGSGDGDDIAYWNRYVAVTQMGGHGTFSDSRTGVSVTHGSDDLVSPKLAALQAYQLSIAAPLPPAGSFDATAAARGKAVFEGQGH